MEVPASFSPLSPFPSPEEVKPLIENIFSQAREGEFKQCQEVLQCNPLEIVFLGTGWDTQK